MLTCRRYYRRLFLSGRLLTIYSALYQDLRTRGQADLTDLVNQGCFTIFGNALVLSPGLPVPAPHLYLRYWRRQVQADETWQLRTALLFMQQAWQVSRHILRAEEKAHPRGFPHFR